MITELSGLDALIADLSSRGTLYTGLSVPPVLPSLIVLGVHLIHHTPFTVSVSFPAICVLFVSPLPFSDTGSSLY